MNRGVKELNGHKLPFIVVHSRKLYGFSPNNVSLVFLDGSYSVMLWASEEDEHKTSTILLLHESGAIMERAISVLSQQLMGRWFRVVPPT